MPADNIKTTPSSGWCRASSGESGSTPASSSLRRPALSRGTHRTRCAGSSGVGSGGGCRGHPGEPGDHPGRLSRWTGSRAHRRAAGPCAVPLARLAPQHDRAAVTRPHGAHRRRRCVPRAPDGHRREASGGALLHSGISLIATRLPGKPVATSVYADAPTGRQILATSSTHVVDAGRLAPMGVRAAAEVMAQIPAAHHDAAPDPERRPVDAALLSSRAASPAATWWSPTSLCVVVPERRLPIIGG